MATKISPSIFTHLSQTLLLHRNIMYDRLPGYINCYYWKKTPGEKEETPIIHDHPHLGNLKTAHREINCGKTLEILSKSLR